jgi:hypothetical protein
MDLNLANKLEELINQNIYKTNVPYVKGNSVRIKNYVVRKSNVGWLVYNTESNKQEARFFCRASALAYISLLIKGATTRHVFDIDNNIQKHYNDCVFYLHTLKTSKDDIKKDVVKSRYDISYFNTKTATRHLERIILC